MQLVNTAEISRPMVEAWPALTDIEVLVGCIPGAALTGRTGHRYEGEVTVRVGPVSLTFVGSIEAREVDADARRMVVHGTAREQRGQGTVDATIAMVLDDRDGTTTMTVRTELDLGGKVAQFGSGMIQKVSGRIIDQFAQRLERRLSGEAAPSGETGRSVSPVGSTAGSVAPVSWADRVSAVVPLVVAALGGLVFGRSAARFLPLRQS